MEGFEVTAKLNSPQVIAGFCAKPGWALWGDSGLCSAPGWACGSGHELQAQSKTCPP